MFARVVKFAATSEAAAEFVQLLHEKALPKIKAQPGCIDANVEVQLNGSYAVIGISLWETRDYAARFNAEVFPEIVEMLRPYLKAKPVVRTTEMADPRPDLLRRRAAAAGEGVRWAS